MVWLMWSLAIASSNDADEYRPSNHGRLVVASPKKQQVWGTLGQGVLPFFKEVADIFA